MEVKNELSEIWEDLFQELFDYVEQHEEDFDNPYNGGSKEWQEVEDDIEEFSNKFLLETAHKKGLTNITLEDIINYDRTN